MPGSRICGEPGNRRELLAAGDGDGDGRADVVGGAPGQASVALLGPDRKTCHGEHARSGMVSKACPLEHA